MINQHDLPSDSPAGPEPELLTVKQVEALLHVKGQALWRWRSEGKGPPWLHVGRLVRYPKAELLTWIEDQTRRAEEHDVSRHWYFMKLCNQLQAAERTVIDLRIRLGRAEQAAAATGRKA